MAANIADLFGDSDDDSGELAPPSAPRSKSKSPGATPSGRRSSGTGLSDDDDDFQDIPEVRPAPRVQESSEDDDDVVQTAPQDRPVGPPQHMTGALLPIPPINKLRLLQTSKFLAIQTRPTTAQNLREERDSVALDEETGEVRYSYKKQMTMRWRERQLPSGETVIESNARFVKWSDGSTQLLLGDEVLDIAELDNTSANQFLFVRHTHPVAFIQGQGQLVKKLHLRPASLSSKFHRQLTAAAAKKHVKVSKVKSTATVIDPNKIKAQREKAEEERIRSRETLQRRQDREMKKYPTISRREYRPAGITPQFLETMEDEPDYSDDEEEPPREGLQRKRHLEEEEEAEAERRLARAKQEAPRRQSEERNQRAERQTTGLDSSDDEEDIGVRQPVNKARRVIISDDEDE